MKDRYIYFILWFFLYSMNSLIIEAMWEIYTIIVIFTTVVFSWICYFKDLRDNKNNEVISKKRMKLLNKQIETMKDLMERRFD